MRFLITVVLFLFSFAYLAFAGDQKLVSPRGTFAITQHEARDLWTIKFHFTKPGIADITFKDTYLWAALFYVSPDDQWIFRIQKNVSGDNISFLYRLDSNGHLRCMEEHFDKRAFEFLEHSLSIDVAAFYHTKIEFTDWDLKAGILRFTAIGSSPANLGPSMRRKLIYDLDEHKFRTP